MYGLRSPHLSAGMTNRSSISTDFSETASFISTAPSNASSVIGDFSVLCLHDYEPTDPDQLGFQKGDILQILKTEDTGWWAAAMGSAVGWVPRGYVEPISDAMADALRSVNRDRRRMHDSWDGHSGISGDGSGSASSPRGSTDTSSFVSSEEQLRGRPGSSSRTQSSEDHTPQRYRAPPVRPIAIHSNGTGGFYAEYGDYRSQASSPSIASGLSGRVPVEFAMPLSPSERSRTVLAPSRRSSRDDDLAYKNAKQAAANLPPYLRPDFGEGFIRLDSEGAVKSGTVEALVERLTIDPLRRSQEVAYRMTFLMTYRTFTDGLTLFELLTERYLMEQPPELTEEQFAEWKERRLRPTQTRVLTTLTEWVERYRFVKDESHLVQKLRDFLTLIKQPPNNALTAKQLLQTIEKQEATIAAAQSQQPFAGPSSPPGSGTSPPPSSIVTKRSLKLPLPASSSKKQNFKNELLKLDPMELAQHLTLVEYRLYAKIRPYECMLWSQMQEGPEVENLLKFCSTSDKLVAWVKYSILKEDSLGKRADIIDFWIKVAEKCRSLNNIASMMAIVAALASSVIVRLALTWAHVSKGSQKLEPLTRLTDPSDNFAVSRKFYATADTSCVPFVGGYLTQLSHLADQHKALVLVPIPATHPAASLGLPSSPNSLHSFASGSSGLAAAGIQTITQINFTRLYKCAEVIHQMLRHQVKGYRQANPSPSAPHAVPDPSSAMGLSLGVENSNVMAFVDTMLNTGGVGLTPPPSLPVVNMNSPPADQAGSSRTGPSIGVVEAWYFQRSSELQKIEVETFDIRKGLEAAGF